MKRKTHKIYVRSNFKPKRDWAVFLDRDGTINVEKHLVHKLKDFELIPGAVGAIGLLNDNEIPVVVLNNASVVSRGLCDEDQVVKLHKKMRRLLGKDGAYVDVVLFCPHNPRASNARYKYDCSWRKPKPGMLRFTSEKFGFDLSKSFVVGDMARDMLIAQAEGAFSILVRTGHSGKDVLYQAKPDKIVKDISEAMSFILKKVK